MTTTKITVETESLTIVRRAHVAARWCPQCGAEVPAVCVHQAPSPMTPMTDALRATRWADGAGVHRWQAVDGSTWLCGQSLAQQLGSQELQQLLGDPPDGSTPNRSEP
jgi:hypothetical protein